jgi:hypothetical protein
VLGYEREWHDAFRDRPVVTICPFIVGGLDGPATVDALAEMSENHTGVLIPEAGGGFRRLRPDALT